MGAARGVRRARAGDRSELVRMRQSLWPDSEPDEVDEVLFHLQYGFEETDRVVCYRKSLDPSSVTNSSA